MSFGMNTNNREEEKLTRRFYSDMLIMLIAPVVMAWYYYGTAVFKTIIVSVLTAVVLELIASFLSKGKGTLKDLNAVFTGVVIALLLPANVSLWLAVLGCAFAILIAKMPFGGTRFAPFMPAAAGFAFICLCRPQAVFLYPTVGIVSNGEATYGVSLASMLKLNQSMGLNVISFFNVFIGNIAGPVGATCIMVLIGAAVFLAIRQPKSAINSAGFIAGSAIMALLFPRVLNGILASLVFELCSGMLIFTALFLITDPATSPKRPQSRFLYGAFAGILCMVMRYFGIFQESACFAVLISSAVWPLVTAGIKRLVRYFDKKSRAKPKAGREMINER